ncbi:methyltransferase domain-containing protein [Gloeocapsopsis dulcis]|uniref:methyltransferase domain-containing protein n=1 Tax=Gloeocapsopsis dulcis TaxID=2859516 RepID=UPI0012DAA9B7|nr:methyltransferase domain-containing protein [Gloeocapsopsis dulcis]WNN89267.1 methyltransferase domain-containing protein [Gloeocapsopsis dulcis]
MRTVEDIFFSLQEKPFKLIKISQFKSNFKVSADSFRIAVFRSIELKNFLYGKKARSKSISYISFVKQDVDHGSARKAVSNLLNNLFVTAFPNWRCQDPGNIECWGFWSKDDLFVGIRITPHSVRARDYRNGERKASLRPTIAAAMAVLSNPNERDRVIDPMCGSGTLLIERGLLSSYASLQGYDIDPEAVKLAATNISNANLRDANVKSCDSTTLHLETESADILLCNLPFGKVYGNKETNTDLYIRCLQEWGRVVKTGGRAILLTSDTKCFMIAHKHINNYWQITDTFRFKVMGIYANCFVLHKT